MARPASATRSSQVEELLARLRDGPDRITAATKNVAAERLHAAPARDEWSANEVLAHLRACQDVWGSAVVTIIEADHPTIRGVNPRHFIKGTDYAEQDFQRAFRAFKTQRKRLLKVLESLSVEGWAREATITGAGRPLVRTVRDYVERLVRHERPHLKQIERTLSIGS
jgi:uncharacterized damage-inducible protein DinB